MLGTDRQGQVVHILQQDGGHRHLSDGTDERQNEHHRQNRHRQGQQDQAERLPRGRAIDGCRLFQRGVYGLEVALDGPDVQRYAAHVSQDKATVGVETQPGHIVTYLVEQRIDGHQCQHGREHLEDQHPLQYGLLAAKTQAGKRIGTSGRQRHYHQGRDAGDLDGVPQPGQHGERRRRYAAIGVGDGHAQRQLPVIQGRIGGDDFPHREVAVTKRDGNDHDHREDDQRQEGPHDQVGCPHPVFD